MLASLVGPSAANLPPSLIQGDGGDLVAPQSSAGMALTITVVGLFGTAFRLGDLLTEGRVGLSFPGPPGAATPLMGGDMDDSVGALALIRANMNGSL